LRSSASVGERGAECEQEAISFGTYQRYKHYQKEDGIGEMAANGLSARKQQSNGNQRITPAKRKIAAWQSTDRASQKMTYGTAIKGLRRPTEKSQCGNQ
jgi:hypothetical protein